MKVFRREGWLAVALAVAIGCGGGGGGTTPTTGSTNGGNGGGTGGVALRSRVGIYVTDALGNYDHVWVTIHKVEVVGAAGSTTVFEDAGGKVIDLVSLNQAGQQQFALLGIGTVPPGTYSQVKITVDDGLILFPTGSSIGEAKQFAGSSNGTKSLSFAIAAGTTDAIVADFDLSQWSEAGGLVTAVVVPGDPDDVNEETQVDQDFDGAVANLSGTAPNLTFDVTAGTATIRVQADATTAVANADGSENPTLANGKSVRVTGILDTASQVLNAKNITIHVAGPLPTAEADGTVSAIGTDGFTLSILTADGFVPSSTTVEVKLAEATAFMDQNGLALTRAEFGAALAVGAEAEAQGAYDAASNTLTAETVQLEIEEQDEEAVEIKVTGPASTINVAAGTFKITVQKWEGTVLTPGTQIDVVTNASTDFRDTSMESLSNGLLLEVRGTLTGSTLTAARVKGKKGGGNGKG